MVIQNFYLKIKPKLAQSIQKFLIAVAQKQEVEGHPAVLLVAAPLRPMLSRFAQYTFDGLKVLSSQEIPDNKQVTVSPWYSVEGQRRLGRSLQS